MKLTFEEQSKADNLEYWERYSKWWKDRGEKTNNE